MRLDEALGKIHAPKGFTSLLAGVMSGDFDPIRGVESVEKSLEAVEARLAKTREAQRTCQSDWAYWGYAGDISYLCACRDILKAAILVGPDNLLDTELKRGTVVMDCCANVEEFGRTILWDAEARTRTGEGEVMEEKTKEIERQLEKFREEGFRLKDTYTVSSFCRNCGYHGSVTFPKGQERHPCSCPRCGCMTFG